MGATYHIQSGNTPEINEFIKNYVDKAGYSTIEESENKFFYKGKTLLDDLLIFNNLIIRVHITNLIVEDINNPECDCIAYYHFLIRDNEIITLRDYTGYYNTEELNKIKIEKHTPSMTEYLLKYIPQDNIIWY